MPSFSTLCIDANLVVGLYTGSLGPIVREMWLGWQRENRSLVAPFLIRYEVANVLYRHHRQGFIDLQSTREALAESMTLPIRLYSEDDLHDAAVVLAERFHLPAAYDAHYLALAERLGIDFYTGDRRLWNTVRHQLPWVRLIETE
ncbi:MAG: type II toxin-antitoxin system VapC family toxin [Thermomicrobiales bacterium]